MRTGRAGRSDDSIFTTLTGDMPQMQLKAGEEIGPLCEECYAGLFIIGALKEELR